MDVLVDLVGDVQPGYEEQVGSILARWLRDLGPETFEGLERSELTGAVIAALDRPDVDAGIALQVMSDLAAMSWWCGLELDDAGRGALAAAARRTCYNAARGMRPVEVTPDPAALGAHAVFIGTVVNPLHSPTRGAFAYIHALTRDPANRVVDVYYSGRFDADLQAYARERLGDGVHKARFISIVEHPDFLAHVVADGPRTFHFWCEPAHAIHITLLALLGPTVMFTCGDAAPVQFADVYWFNHDAEVMRERWARRGAPAAFIENYCATSTAAFCGMKPQRKRSRAEFGWSENDVVFVTAGNRLGIDMDQSFVDGVAGFVLGTPQARWVIAGRLPDYFVSAFEQVLGDRFTHVPFDPDLMSLLERCDIYANPFRAGGGYTAAMAIEAGAVVLTRGDLGDVGTLTPPAHQADSAEAYFDALEALTGDKALRAAWLAQQQGQLMRMFDQDVFAEELKALTALAFERFAARQPTSLEELFAQAPPKRLALKRAGRAARLR